MTENEKKEYASRVSNSGIRHHVDQSIDFLVDKCPGDSIVAVLITVLIAEDSIVQAFMKASLAEKDKICIPSILNELLKDIEQSKNNLDKLAEFLKEVKPC